MRIALVVSALALAGCISEAPVDLQANCRGYGFKEGTDAFAGCVQKETLAWQDNQRAMMRTFGDDLRQKTTQTNCTTSSAYGTSNTQC